MYIYTHTYIYIYTHTYSGLNVDVFSILCMFLKFEENFLNLHFIFSILFYKFLFCK